MKKYLSIILISIFTLGVIGQTKDKYQANWESLSKHNTEPEWLKDAKLGIYFHWGPYSVPAFAGEWYPRWMFFKGTNQYDHHKETYGDPHVFGYHDFVPLFKAEYFDAEDWADLFEKAGARFAGPVAEHHDGFAMWDSEVTPWNAKDKGPHKDVLGDLFNELEKRDIKTIATFHHSKNLQRYKDAWKDEIDTSKIPWNRRAFRNSHYPYIPGFPTASEDAELRLLYGNMPEKEWNEKIWFGKLKEVIDNYQPDIIWFDSWLDQVPEEYRQRFAAYYFNEADKWDKEVVIVRKQQDLPLEMSINDHEKSREPKALKELWMTDDTYSTGSWSYTNSLKLKPTSKIVHSLVDAVSKNGILLLNISPMANGIIPDNQRKGLLELGQWLKENGEAIYNTRPWIKAAEGPTDEPSGGFSDAKKFLNLQYTAKDIRYTRSKDAKTVYAILLGVPDVDSETIMETFASANIKVKNVSTLNGEKLNWKMGPDGLRINTPKKLTEYAQVYKIKIK